MHFEADFFRAEKRCDFQVPSMMKHAWAAQLEVLDLVSEICKKYNLTYYADWGTLLGAIRHKGFIPWDDDIDIALKRPDYETLLKVLPKELPKGFAIGGYLSDNSTTDINTILAPLRVNALLSQWDSYTDYIDYFHGYPFPFVGIDLFPLDYVTENPEEADIQKNLITITAKITLDWNNLNPQEKKEKLNLLQDYTGVSLPEDNTLIHLRRLIDSLSSIFQESDGNQLCHQIENAIKSPNVYPASCFESSLGLPFENSYISVPNGYEEILTLMYGDYHKIIKFQNSHDYPYYKEMEKTFLSSMKQAGIHDSIDIIVNKLMNHEITLNLQ
ncbi:MAG: LicD family protein [Eubacterium sp.]|nr:LicD family protein [Eubacterium sp.]